MTGKKRVRFITFRFRSFKRRVRAIKELRDRKRVPSTTMSPESRSSQCFLMEPLFISILREEMLLIEFLQSEIFIELGSFQDSLISQRHVLRLFPLEPSELSLAPSEESL